MEGDFGFMVNYFENPYIFQLPCEQRDFFHDEILKLEEIMDSL